MTPGVGIVCYDKNEEEKTEMIDNDVKRRNERLSPTVMAVGCYDQWLSRAEYEECCSRAGIEPRADEEIRRDEDKIRVLCYTYSEDPTGELEIRRRIESARLSAMSLAE
jgi:hypothetical protein